MGLTLYQLPMGAHSSVISYRIGFKTFLNVCVFSTFPPIQHQTGAKFGRHVRLFCCCLLCITKTFFSRMFWLNTDDFGLSCP